MEQYIPKSALVAEIKRLLAFYSKEIEDNKEDPWAMDIAKRDILQEILSFLDTLEAKEVDLDWKNVRELCVLSAVVELEKGRSLTDQEHYTEVIKRFKAQKG